MSTTYSRLVYGSSGGEVVVEVRVCVDANWAASGGTNYWTLYLRRLAPGREFGETICSYDLGTRSLTAFKPVTVYDDANGFQLDDGDRLVQYAVMTGSPAVPSNLVFQIDLQGR